ncbi:uncharacterized protein NEMAJ01_0788 [Nematocida major]|uniref:uncharacterized protein n=1 Tax=Nematocida major TaxID=1912982 RepID=UPI002008AA59|nr:uncharacterized protein NEMAJ01_0788 [Nematocida major]KAH9385892.1 hypothetical protein NEMAJ01_0788 [Nematocida major]
MNEVVSVKFVREESPTEKGPSKIEGEFLSRFVIQEEETLSLVSPRQSKKITLEGKYVGTAGNSIWVQQGEFLVKFSLLGSPENSFLSEVIRVCVGKAKVRVSKDEIFVKEKGSFSVRSLQMEEIAKIPGSFRGVSEGSVLAADAGELVLWGREKYLEIWREKIDEGAEYFLLENFVLSVRADLLTFSGPEFSGEVRICIDVEEEEEPGHFIVRSFRVGPIEQFFVVAHTNSVDIEYVVFSGGKFQKFIPHEELDGLAVPFGESLKNLHVLESTVLQDVNLEDKEILQGPTVAVETEDKVTLYGMMLDLCDLSAYVQGRRGREPEINQVKNNRLPNGEVLPDMEKEETAAKPEKTEQESAGSALGKPAADVSESAKDAEKEPSDTSKIPNGKTLPDTEKEEKIAEPEKECVLSQSTGESTAPLQEERKPRVSNPIPLSALVKDPEENNLKVAENFAEKFALKIPPGLRESSRGKEGNARKVESAPEKDPLPNTVKLNIPERENPMARIKSMLQDLGSGEEISGIKKPISEVRENIQELREILGRCRERMEKIELPKEPSASLSVKGILAGIEEAIILIKDQKIRLKDVICEREASQEKAKILALLVESRLSRAEKVLSGPPLDFSREIEHINTRISNIFNISAHSIGKARDQVTPGSISVYSEPLKMHVPEISLIEEGAILPEARDKTFDLLDECIEKIKSVQIQGDTLSKDGLMQHIFRSPNEAAFLRAIHERKAPEKTGPFEGSQQASRSLSGNSSQILSKTESFLTSSSDTNSTRSSSLLGRNTSSSSLFQSSNSSNSQILSNTNTNTSTSNPFQSSTSSTNSSPMGSSLFQNSSNNSNSQILSNTNSSNTSSSNPFQSRSSTSSSSLFQSSNTNTNNNPFQSSNTSSSSLFQNTNTNPFQNSTNTNSNPFQNRSSNTSNTSSSSLFQNTNTNTNPFQNRSNTNTSSSSLFQNTNTSNIQFPSSTTNTNSSLFQNTITSNTSNTSNIQFSSSNTNTSSNPFQNTPQASGTLFGGSPQGASFPGQSPGNSSFSLLSQSSGFTQGSKSLGLSGANPSSLFKKKEQ